MPGPRTGRGGAQPGWQRSPPAARAAPAPAEPAERPPRRRGAQAPRARGLRARPRCGSFEEGGDVPAARPLRRQLLRRGCSHPPPGSWAVPRPLACSVNLSWPQKTYCSLLSPGWEEEGPGLSAGPEPFGRCCQPAPRQDVAHPLRIPSGDTWQTSPVLFHQAGCEDRGLLRDQFQHSHPQNVSPGPEQWLGQALGCSRAAEHLLSEGRETCPLPSGSA